MKEFITNNWQSILIVVCFIAMMISFAARGKWETIRKISYKLILQAETTIAGTKRGQERFDQVLEQIYILIPAWIRFFAPKSLVKEKLQEWFNEVKDYLDNGKVDGSIGK